MAHSKNSSKLKVSLSSTVLIFDTNYFIHNLQTIITSYSLHWQISIPLAVINELKGLQNGDLELQATKSLSWITQTLSTQSSEKRKSKQLRIQTVGGSFLTNLTNTSESWDSVDVKNGDDIIIHCCSFYKENGDVPVVLITKDVNMRLKCRGKEIMTIGELKEVENIIKKSTLN